ncbi:MAG: sulfatase-like hydrolase/transferase, partial [Chthoniobacteraceae bacterium]
MKSVLVLIFAVLGGVLFAADKPNIVFIVADDLGWSDLSCYGSTFYETPHLDRLAQEGARFTNAYAACPVCSPTRAALLTGKYPQRTGVTDYIGAPQPEQWKRNTKLLPAPYATELALSETTLAESLQAAGYATFFAGKWHLGPEEHWPENQGFEVNMGGIDRGGPYGGKKYFSPYGNPRLEDGPDGEHLPDRLASEAVKFIAAHQAGPFLVYLSFYSVHTPLISREDLRQKYEAKRKRLELEEKWGREEPRDVRLVQDHAVYAGMVEAMDMAVGKVLEALDTRGLRETTIVVFTSDNGGLSTSEGWPTSNLPLRGGKGWLYEGGIREPLIVRWPGRTQTGQVIDTPVSSQDFMPTFLVAADVELPANLDGRDLAPLFSHEGELVLDPFVGSGTTLLAAQELNRNAVGFDLQERYAALATSRLHNTDLFGSAQQVVVTDDARQIDAYLEPESVKLIWTSPPYANLLNRKRKNKSRRDRV